MHMWLAGIYVIRTHFLHCAHGGKSIATRCILGFFRLHCLGCWVPCFTWINSCFPSTIFLIIVAISGYCAYSRWYLHFGRCNHYWLDLCKFCFASYFFLKSGHDDCSLGKGYVISWPTLWEWFHPFNNVNIWIFTLVSWLLLSLMC
jgi:hypothetical protein